MARISYVEEKDHPELAADIAKIKGARGGLINIYKLLLHSPTVTMTWFEHIGAIRWKTKLTPRLREIAIVRVAQAARYAYALNQHVPTIAVPDGVSLEECEALKDWRASKFFNEAERAALAYVDTMIAGPDRLGLETPPVHTPAQHIVRIDLVVAFLVAAGELIRTAQNERADQLLH